jgi:hydroxyacylglutathione hydrolase
LALVFEQFLTEEIGDASYFVGDDSAGVAAVVDPQVDVDRYVSAARSRGLTITHVVQTHIHEDFLSGAIALANAVAGAEVCVGGHDAPRYGFPHRLVHDGHILRLGGVALTVKHTPGHTPEHLALLVTKAGKEEAPFAVLSGGSLLVEAAGRTDLLGDDRVDDLVRAQFGTLRRFFLGLDDSVMVYPTHVHGSPCGAAIGDKTCTTIGYERRHNPLLQHEDEASFRRAALADLPPKPRYYPRLKERNTSSQPGSAPSANLRPLPPRVFKEALDRGEAVLVDTRHMLAFGGGHIPGSLNIAAAGHLSIWAGWMLDPDRPLLLVLDSDDDIGKVARDFGRTGFERFAGYLAGGMSSWENEGLQLQALPQLHVTQLASELAASTVNVLDVRSPQEWTRGHVPGAHHVFLPDLPGQLGSLDRSRRTAVYCDTGYRASIAASLLQSNGFEAANVPGSWKAWISAGLPAAKPKDL